MNENFDYIMQNIIKDEYLTSLINGDYNFDKLWEKVKHELKKEHRRLKLEQIYPDIKNNNDI